MKGIDLNSILPFNGASKSLDSSSFDEIARQDDFRKQLNDMFRIPDKHRKSVLDELFDG